MTKSLAWYEFFAGGGMARLGLGPRWDCVFSNEWCEKKAAAYAAYFGSGTPRHCRQLRVADVAGLTAAELPGHADLAWASFPCQDLSLAGNGAGLQGLRSGTFIPFWKLITGLASENRAPKIVALENVVGTLTSHDGKDFACIIDSLVRGGYRAGGLVMDAIRFLPQSRPRLFIVAIREEAAVPSKLVRSYPSPLWHTKAIRESYAKLSGRLQAKWLWWHLPEPPQRSLTLSSLIEREPRGVDWHTPEQTERLLSMMSDLNRAKLREIQTQRTLRIGTVYKRTRPDGDGKRVQRAEVRFDEVSGCLRTPAGGSSRQIILAVEGRKVRSRLLSPREAARLMGVPEDYPLPARYNDSYHLFGDGLAVPAVAWLADHLLTPLALDVPQEAAA